ncbi:YfiR family protein [Teichococcus vastitatis]|nr:hypothetical protein [Pseudoroseomonas vastitatis]
MVALAALGTLACVSPVRAELGLSDLQVMARVTGFLEPPLRGVVPFGIVYPAGSITGHGEGRRLLALLNDSLAAGAVVLRPEMITFDEAISGRFPVLLLTEAMAPQAPDLARSLRGSGVLTMSSAPTLVNDGLAVLAVRSHPRVEIFVSRKAAHSSGIFFANAFRMMIQER